MDAEERLECGSALPAHRVADFAAFDAVQARITRSRIAGASRLSLPPGSKQDKAAVAPCTPSRAAAVAVDTCLTAYSTRPASTRPCLSGPRSPPPPPPVSSLPPPPSPAEGLNHAPRRPQHHREMGCQTVGYARRMAGRVAGRTRGTRGPMGYGPSRSGKRGSLTLGPARKVHSRRRP